MNELLRRIRDRADLLALAGMLAAVLLLPERIPAGIYGVGIVAGAALALQALGLVLIYRSSRIINFAQVQVGVFAGVLFRLLVEQSAVLRMVDAFCDPCIGAPSAASAAVNYWVSLAISLGAAVALSFAIYAGVMKRFADAPRLVLTVATIGVAQLLASMQSALPGLLATQQQKDLSQLPTGAAAIPPIEATLRWDPVIFRAADVLTIAVVAAAVGALMAYFRSSRRGLAIRAAAENRDRAATLGINVNAANSRVWLIAGVLSAVAGILVAMSAPAGPVTSVNIGEMVRILAAAVIASMTSLPIAVVAALVLGVFDQAMLWAFSSTAPVDAILTGVIALVLLLRRARASRVEQELAGAWRAAREVRPLPPQLRAHPSVKRWARLATFGGIGLLLAAPFVLSPLQTTALTRTAIYAMVGVSLLVLSGWAGQISLGQFALAAVGAYVAAMTGAPGRLPMPLAVVAGGLAAAVVAGAVGLPALRMRGLHLAITTLGLALATSAILLDPAHLGQFLPEAVARPSLVGIDLDDGRTFFFFTLLVLVAVVAAAVGLRRSRFGRGLIGARDNELAAQSFGVALTRTRLTAFVASGFIAGIAGSIFVYQQYGLKAASFTPDVSITMFLMAVIGGLGSVAGPIAGALYLGVLDLLSVSPLVLFLATGGGVIVLLLLAPGGLAQLGYDIRDAALRRFARRNGIDVPSLLGIGAAEGRAPVAPKLGPAGSTAFVAARYRVPGQWGIEDA